MRRSGTDPTLDAFRAAAEPLDRAQRALLAAIPTSRDPGVPLAEAIHDFERHLADAERLISSWRSQATAPLNDVCTAALATARQEAERLRLEPGTLGFEQLNARIGDVLDSLEVFVDAERELKRKKAGR